MSLLISNASGTAANTADNTGRILVNRDPCFVANSLLNTVFFWAQTWDTAQVQLFISPQLPTMIGVPQTIWVPITDGVFSSANGYFNFTGRWGQIKAVVSNATALTSGLYVALFDGVG